MMDELYIVQVTRDDVSVSSEPVVAAVYAPGIVCADCDNTLYRCYLVRTRNSYILVGRDCAADRGGVGGTIHQWEQALAERLRVMEANLPENWGELEGNLQGRVRLAKRMYRLLHFEAHPFTQGMARRLEERGALSERQWKAIACILTERGNLATMRRRRDLGWRLRLLAELDLRPEDRAAVERMQRWNRGAGVLSSRDERRIWALEDNYLAQRRKQSAQRAVDIAQTLEYFEVR